MATATYKAVRPIPCARCGATAAETNEDGDIFVNARKVLSRAVVCCWNCGLERTVRPRRGPVDFIGGNKRPWIADEREKAETA